ncbi:MAG: glycosyltransferase [Bryobacterales bacterium]|jgi:spore maturation protein CgeB|nr:glycosyltransferase [Bryobacterales bacterium]
MSLRVAMFYHSLVSDWNHGNAHFLRGVVAELQARGHRVEVYEPEGNWSTQNLLRDHGNEAVEAFSQTFPNLKSHLYDSKSFDVSEALDGVDLVLVHEWNEPALVAQIGQLRRTNARLRALFHDTHHRAITAPREMARFELGDYDGVLAYGASLARAYEKLGWGKRVHIWHEAADTRVFYPRQRLSDAGDIVWIGNWGDEERSEELREFLIEPVRRGGWKARVHGVRYPESALEELSSAGIEYRGWLPNFRAPEVFAQFRATVHVPRRPYVQQLAGIPTIRPFEALACGIPMVSAPWLDTEGLFRVGQDFLMARDGNQMGRHLADVLNDSELAATLSENGLETIRNRHTCGHRVTELLKIFEDEKGDGTRAEANVLAEVRQ